MTTGVDEDILGSNVSDEFVRIIWGVEGQEVFGREVGVEEVPEFWFGEGDFLFFSVMDLVCQQVRVVVKIQL